VTPSIIIAIASLFAALSLWLLLPHARAGGQRLGVVLGLASVGLFGWLLASIASGGSSFVFYTLAAVAVIAAAGTITMRNPVYSAIWFAMCLLSIGALLLFTAAQFLAVATVAVYAGAILVTLLFVLMLAQPDGHAVYDRISWEPMISAFAGAALIGVLTCSVFQAMLPQAGTYARQGTPSDHDARERHTQIATAVLESQHNVSAGPAAILAMEITGHLAATSHHRSVQDQRQDVMADQHMAHVGAQLFSRHLISIQLAAVLLLIALVGAVAIVIQGRERDTHTEADTP
jgi:NADH-quinone oxidoreductase subunit J